MAEKEVPLGANQDVHPVPEALGSRPDEDIVKGPPARDDARFVKVGSADDPFEADLLTDALDEAEIPVAARATRDMLMDPLVVPAPIAWEILVPAEFEARARAIVAEKSAAIEAGAGDAARAAEEEEAATEEADR
jgi:hypothetical protein